MDSVPCISYILLSTLIGLLEQPDMHRYLNNFHFACNNIFGIYTLFRFGIPILGNTVLGIIAFQDELFH